MPDLKQMSPIVYLAIGGKALQKVLPLWDESLTRGITAGVLQN